MSKFFDIPADSLEVSFTFLYDLGGPIRIESDPLDQVHVPPHVALRASWPESEIGFFIDRVALSQIVLRHFHMFGLPDTITAISDRRVAMSLPDVEIEFRVPHAYRGYQGREFTSVAGVECSLYPSGHLAVVLRMHNRQKIDAADVVDLIRHPEHSSSRIKMTLEAGSLVVEAVRYLEEQIEPSLVEVLKGHEIQYLTGDGARWLPLELSCFDLQEARFPTPYVGTVFSLPDTDLTNPDKQPSRSTIQRFVIACFRTTPSFLESFAEPSDEYLRRKGRDAYGAGDSILAIGSRGFCAFDAERDNRRDTFRIGVVETAHFVINVVRSAAAGFQRFIWHVGQQGGEPFDRLHGASVEWAVWPLRTIDEWKASRDAGRFVAQARRLLPRNEGVRVLRSAIRSHSGRTAYERAEYLFGLQSLADRAESLLDCHDTALQQSRDRIVRQMLWATIGALIVTMAGLLLPTVF